MEERLTRSNEKTMFQEEPFPVSICEIGLDETQRLFTAIGELDRVLGGGIVPGSLVLVGGDPGIGKSTLLLQACQRVATRYGKVLYISGEESLKQTKMRANRLGADCAELYVLAETNVERIVNCIEQLKPALAIIDSIQTVFCPELEGAPGSIGQIREATARLMVQAKTRGIPVFLVGHVTKQGFLAGPRVLEHMVDTVLYFEGERHHAFRVLRAVKNRFGSTNELGVFQMVENGLQEVQNPSEMFLAERPVGASGSVVVSNLEGTRPVLLEIQALVSQSSLGNPRRLATGLELNRVLLMIAILEKRLGFRLSQEDIYLNVAGGVRASEPAADLGICVAIASGFRNTPVDQKAVVMGEVGLAGEIRGISQVEKRIAEATKLGFTRCILPKKSAGSLHKVQAIEIIAVETVGEALEAALGG